MMEIENTDTSNPKVIDLPDLNQSVVRYWECGEYAWLYERLVAFLDSVLNADQIPFHVRRQGSRKIAVRTPVGAVDQRNLAGFIHDCQRFMDLYYPDWSYSADFQLFFDCYREHPFSDAFLVEDANSIFSSDLIVGEVYNDFIAYLRRQAIARKVRKRLADWKAGLRYQAESASDRLARWSAANKLLVPVRVDLFYEESGVVADDLLPRMAWCKGIDGQWMRVPSHLSQGSGLRETRARIDPTIAFEDRNRFFDNQYGADRDLFEHMRAYISKMECGGKRHALHQHCLFLFDGTQAVDVNELVGRIAARWRKVTRNSGLVFNCHEGTGRADMIRKGVWALDPLRCGDEQQLAKLQRYVEYYFAKDDGQVLRAKPTSRANALVMTRR
ncbi:hypothetical protein [Burkholderia pseudomallei]|uniref:hypothetical protein n=2 Tax=Burkholderiaceae TaxID=119060 RepID=UPI001AD62FFA|nr:hypothetical protein [Burkholderia pseudomallei]MBO7885732.1 hypothetical protein [Burkholderia pseudomallei]MBO7891640.1 hypothetical protein [Burkholderia pseudomallei]